MRIFEDTKIVILLEIRYFGLQRVKLLLELFLSQLNFLLRGFKLFVVFWCLLDIEIPVIQVKGTSAANTFFDFGEAIKFLTHSHSPLEYDFLAIRTKDFGHTEMNMAEKCRI